MSEEAVVFERLFEDAAVPLRSTERSAGYDLVAHLRGRRVTVYREGEERELEAGPMSETGAGATSPSPTGEAGIVLRPGDRALVPTGFRARLPPGFEAQIRIRSSLAYRKGLVVPNAPGTIDADYPDEWFVLLKNASSEPVGIRHGDRIAQAVLSRYAALPWREGDVGISTDRTGGLGSTGR